MNPINLIVVEGNLVKEPLCRSTNKKGTAICSFSVAVNRFFKNGEEVEKEVSFFDIESWGKLAESCCSLGHKGRGVRITGRLKQERWSAADGGHRSKVVVVAESVEWKPEKKIEDQGEDEAGETTVE